LIAKQQKEVVVHFIEGLNGTVKLKANLLASPVTPYPLKKGVKLPTNWNS